MSRSDKAQNPALQVLRDVDATVRSALDSRGGRPASTRTGDGLVQRVAMTILTHRATLDWLIERFSRGQVRQRTRRVLWWALAEGLYLDGLPTPVIVDTAVRAVKRRNRAESRFVNAILRRILSLSREEVFSMVEKDAPLWVRLDLGKDLYDLWSSRMTQDRLAELAAVLTRPAATVVRLRRGCNADDLAGVEPLDSPDWAPTAQLLACVDAPALFGSKGWREGRAYIQDPSTLLAPGLLAVQPGDCVADLCSAPGGKALILLEALDEAGRLVCMDRSARRLRRLQENLSPSAAVTVLAGDATAPPFADGVFDACLLDVPCSNTGVIRRRPDVRWHVTPARVSEVATLQLRILRSAAKLVKPGGRLVYSTCSIEPQENEDLIGAFLEAAPDYRLVEQRTVLPAGEHDGAFAALLKRCGAED